MLIYSPTAINKPEESKKSLNVTTMTGNSIHLECDSDYTIVNLLGSVIANGEGDSTVSLLTSGIYIVSSGNESRKIVVQ